MAVSIPTHDQWKKFKATHGVGSNAVSSVNVGKALDKFHAAFSRNFAKNADAASDCYKVLATYFAKYPDKKSAAGKKFLDAFEKNYVKMASAAVEEFSTMAGNMKTFGGRVVLLMTQASKLAAGTDLGALQLFRQGPVRGMLAAAKQVKGYDPSKLETLWSPIDELINKLGADTDQATLDKVVKLCHVTSKTSMDVGKKEGLF